MSKFECLLQKVDIYFSALQRSDTEILLPKHFHIDQRNLLLLERYRNAYRKSTVSIKSWLRASQNYIDDTEVRVQRRRTAGWELGLNHREFFGTSSLDLSLNQRQGTGAFGARRAPEELFDEGTSRMLLTTTEIQLTIPFNVANQNLRYVSNVRAQWNQTLLVAQDRFLIGGRYSVRGFDGR